MFSGTFSHKPAFVIVLKYFEGQVVILHSKSTIQVIQLLPVQMKTPKKLYSKWYNHLEEV